jgi:hypothetical protein
LVLVDCPPGQAECLLRYFEITGAPPAHDHGRPTAASNEGGARDDARSGDGDGGGGGGGLPDGVAATTAAPGGPWREKFRGEVALTTATHVGGARSDPSHGLRVFFPCGRALKVRKGSLEGLARTWPIVGFTRLEVVGRGGYWRPKTIVDMLFSASPLLVGLKLPSWFCFSLNFLSGCVF